jgi:hypothetical protein
MVVLELITLMHPEGHGKQTDIYIQYPLCSYSSDIYIFIGFSGTYLEDRDNEEPMWI